MTGTGCAIALQVSSSIAPFLKKRLETIENFNVNIYIYITNNVGFFRKKIISSVFLNENSYHII